MTINRHNYEEFFILYMDNELAADDRRAVEAFVQLHPDLKEELDLLLQYKLEPDTTIVFAGKEELQKINGETPVSLSNYEEWMILYTDHELTAAQQLQFEQFMIAHPGLTKEFEQFKQSKLVPEHVTFTGKASLYRKEEKMRRLPAWWRFAAAAILLLAIGITAVMVINNNSEGEKKEIVKDATPAVDKTPESPVIVPPAPVKENIAATNDVEIKVAPQQVAPFKGKNMAVNQPVPQREDKPKETFVVPVQQKQEEAVVVRKTNDLPAPLNNPNIKITNNSGNTDIVKHVPAEFFQQNSLTKQDVTTGDPDPSNFVTASVDQSDGSKNKSRGLFRKIARTFEKRTSIDPTDDNRLLVAGLAIKLK